MKRIIKSASEPRYEEWELLYPFKGSIYSNGYDVSLMGNDFPKQLIDNGTVIVDDTESIEEDLCIALERYINFKGNYDVSCNICIPYDTMNDVVVSVGEATFEDIIVSPY